MLNLNTDKRLILIVLGIILNATWALGQMPVGVTSTFITDQYEPEAATASMGFASTVRAGGTWAGLHNPAAWADQPFLYSGMATTDLWNVSDSGARLESGAGGIGVGGIFGAGFSRTRLRFTDPDESAFHLSPLDAPSSEITDVYGAGLNVAKLMAPGNDFMKLSVGANVKIQDRSYFIDGTQAIVVNESYMNYDFGGLVGLRIPLASDADNPVSGPTSFLELRGSYVMRNANRDRFEDEPLGINHEVGLSRTQGFGLSLVLGKVNADRHLIRLSGGTETWDFEQEWEAADKNGFDLLVDDGQRLGLELGLGDVLFARAGRVTVSSLGLEEKTYGGGLQLQIPSLSFRLTADYARVPWLHGGGGGVVVDGGSPMTDKFTLQVALGI